MNTSSSDTDKNRKMEGAGGGFMNLFGLLNTCKGMCVSKETDKEVALD